MKALNAREKNLGLLVLFFGLMFMWWSITRNMEREIAIAEGDTTGMTERLRQGQASVALLNASLSGPAPGAGATGFIAQSATSLALLKELTLPVETKNLKILSVNRADATNFNMVVEGRFIEMMRFISYLERHESNISVGNVGLSRGENTTGNSGNIRGTISIAMRASG